MLLPNSPVRKISQCPKCGEVSLKFYDPQHNKVLKKTRMGTGINRGKRSPKKNFRGLLQKIQSFLLINFKKKQLLLLKVFLIAWA